MSKQSEDRVRELTSLSHHLQALSEREKWELARKLHDELGGLLTAAKMDLSWLQSRLEGAVIQERLSQLGGVLDEAMDLKRRVVEELRPSLLDDFGLVAALQSYVKRQAQLAGFAARFVSVADPPDFRLEFELETACFRVARFTAWAGYSPSGGEYYHNALHFAAAGMH